MNGGALFGLSTALTLACLALACAGGEPPDRLDGAGDSSPDGVDANLETGPDLSLDAIGDSGGDAPVDTHADPADLLAGDSLADPGDGDLGGGEGGHTADADAGDAGLACESDRVILRAGRFERRGEPWAMRGVNYIAEIRYEEGVGYYVGPHHAYCADNICCLDRDTCLTELQDDLATIADLGFTAIRLVGLAARPETGVLIAPTLENLPPNDIRAGPNLSLYDDSQVFADVAVVLDAIGGVLAEADDVGLAVMLLAGHRDVDDATMADLYGYYLADIASTFVDEPALFAIDLMNEPGYEAAAGGTPDKSAANAVVRSWYEAIRAQAPGIHVTMGLTDSDTVRGWDPAALPLDFVTYHPYPHGGFDAVGRARYERDIVWFEQAGIPWAIGETGFAVDDWGSESTQADFATTSANLARDCGALGHLWWTYQDLHWGALEHFGLLRWDETQRPAAERLAAIDWWAPQACPSPPASFNPNGHPDTWAVRGRLLDGAGAPIANGRVIGWRCPDWSGSTVSTFSDPDGRFVLRADTGLVAVDISAPGRERTDFLWPSCAATDFGDLTLDHLGLDITTETPDACP